MMLLWLLLLWFIFHTNRRDTFIVIVVTIIKLFDNIVTSQFVTSHMAAPISTITTLEAAQLRDVVRSADDDGAETTATLIASD